MAAKRPRANVTFHPDMFAALEEASQASGLSISHIVDQLLGAHLGELFGYATWLKKQQSGNKRERAVHLLEVYGPEDLLTGIRMYVDPDFEPTVTPTTQRLEQRYLPKPAESLTTQDVQDLRTMLDEWRAKR